MRDVQQYLDRLVDELRDGGRIRSQAIERAFRAAQRHRFLREFSMWDPETSKPVPVEFDPKEPSDEALRTIYSDEALGTRFREGVPTLAVRDSRGPKPRSSSKSRGTPRTRGRPLARSRVSSRSSISVLPRRA
jgi:hypothetical protein